MENSSWSNIVRKKYSITPLTYINQFQRCRTPQRVILRFYGFCTRFFTWKFEWNWVKVLGLAEAEFDPQYCGPGVGDFLVRWGGSVDHTKKSEAPCSFYIGIYKHITCLNQMAFSASQMGINTPGGSHGKFELEQYCSKKIFDNPIDLYKPIPTM